MNAQNLNELQILLNVILSSGKVSVTHILNVRKWRLRGGSGVSSSEVGNLGVVPGYL